MSERIDGIENAGGSNDLLPNDDVLGYAGSASAQDVTSREATENDNGGTADASGIVVPERHAAMRAVSIDDGGNANGNPTHDGTKPMGGISDAAQDATPSTKPRRRARTRQASGNVAGRKAGRTATPRKRDVTQGKQNADSAVPDEVDFSDSIPNPYIGKVTPDGMHHDAAAAAQSVLTDAASSEMTHDGMTPSTKRADALSVETAHVAHGDALHHVSAKTGSDDDAPETGRAQQHHATLRVTRDDDARNADTANGTPTSPDGKRLGMATVTAQNDGDASSDNGQPNADDGAQHTHIADVPSFMSATTGTAVAGSDAGKK